jgi:hypothetical protein
MTYSEFAQDAVEKLKAIQDSFKAKYDIDGYANWFYTQSTELLRLYNDGIDEVHLKYVPVYVFNQKQDMDVVLGE